MEGAMAPQVTRRVSMALRLQGAYRCRLGRRILRRMPMAPGDR